MEKNKKKTCIAPEHAVASSWVNCGGKEEVRKKKVATCVLRHRFMFFRHNFLRWLFEMYCLHCFALLSSCPHLKKSQFVYLLKNNAPTF